MSQDAISEAAIREAVDEPIRFLIVTPEQFKKGYTMRFGRFEWRVAYREIERTAEGNIIVVAPQYDFGFGE